MALTVAIAGASGYVGGELLRLVASHPDLELKTVTANSNKGEKVSALHPGLHSFGEFSFVETSTDNLANHDVVFLAMPHSKSAEVATGLSDSQLVIDCGADYRLQDSLEWKKFYGTDHAGTWPYGMPELTLASGGKQRGRLRDVKHIAVPGCNVTAITLALAPALTAGLLKTEDIVSVLSVGTSGAGRNVSSNLIASEVLGSANAYGVGGVHRHTPEIEQNLSLAAGSNVTVSFTPVLVPMSRGILAVNTAKLVSSGSVLREVFEDAYGDEQFINLLPEGQFPTTGSVLGSNMAAIGLAIDERAGKVVIVSAIDNLVKGTAGAAIQSMNIALGLPEHTGLTRDGLTP